MKGTWRRRRAAAATPTTPAPWRSRERAAARLHPITHGGRERLPPGTSVEEEVHGRDRRASTPSSRKVRRYCPRQEHREERASGWVKRPWTRRLRGAGRGQGGCREPQLQARPWGGGGDHRCGRGGRSAAGAAATDVAAGRQGR